MPKDVAGSSEPKPKNLAEMFSRQRDADTSADVEIRPLPSTQGKGMRRPLRQAVQADDMRGMAKAILLIGAGGSGKTTLARWMGEEVCRRPGLGEKTLIAAFDPTNRTLADFFQHVMQPETSDPADVADWVRDMLSFMIKNRAPAIMDSGGGDVSIARLIEAAPDLASVMHEEGLALIPFYMLTPRVDDLAILATFEQAGFQPKATALILNMATADTPAAFDAIRRQPAYRAAIDRGAVELWMPALEPQSIALSIERARSPFYHARDGVASTALVAPNISLFDRVFVRGWLNKMNEEFGIVEAWMPWS